MSSDERIERELRDAAERASHHAYSPYSRFRVGAAVLDDQRRVFAACNVENASFGLTVCAERNATFHAIAAGASGLVAVAVYMPGARLYTPCGACRQVLSEFGSAITILLFNDETARRTSLTELLPDPFSLDAT